MGSRDLRSMKSRENRSLSALPARVALVALVSLSGARDADAQCVMCREAAASAPAETRSALNVAILGLAAAPYGIAFAAAWSLLPGFRDGVRRALRGHRTDGK